MTVVDRPVFVESAGEALFAIASNSGAPAQLGVLLLPAGGYTFTPQRNRWAVDLAHRFASIGYPTVRFDWQGIGDSTGTVDTFALHRPATLDATAALSILDTPDRVLVGQCYGARTAMAMAGEVAGLAGVVLLSPPVRDFARGFGTATKKAHELSAGSYLKEGLKQLRPSVLRDRAQLGRILRLGWVFLRVRWRKAISRFRPPDPTPWVSRPFLDQIEALMAAEVPTLLLYGSDENDFREFTEARAGRLGDLLDDCPSSFETQVIPGSVHAMDRVEIQQGVITQIEEWMHRLERSHPAG